jgi:hypothetical protein
MERSFYNEDFDFEQLIKQKSDQYKIYPSDKVWKGINGSLHSSRKWYWLSFALFIAGIGYYAIDQISTPSRKTLANTDQSASTAPDQPGNSNQAVVLPFTPPNVAFSPKRKPVNYREKGLVIAMSELAASEENLKTTPVQQPIVTVETSNISLPSRTIPDRVIAEADFSDTRLSTSHNNDISTLVDTEKGDVVNELAETTVDADALKKDIVSSSNEVADQKRINWLQENAIYELSLPKLKRVSWQAYVSPTMNYRKLVGNKNANLASDVKNIPISLNIEGDIDNLVNHKPALGFEVGGAFLYAVNKNLTFKTGVQFNYSRYDIQAYSSYSTELATIALNNFYGANVDSITSFTRLRNFGGNTPKVLENEYFQLSTPIGVEMLMLGQGKLQLSVAGTVQPTYLLNRDSYLITTDYKNYTREPSLVRRWNVNTSAEAFVSYKAAGFRFQVGPQVRYQLFSTYNEKYPVREFLLEYGVKLGISRTIR